MKYIRLINQLDRLERKLMKQEGFREGGYPSCMGRWVHIHKQIERVRKLIAKEEEAAA